MTETRFKTKVTWLGTEYGCRIYDGTALIVEGRCSSKDMIGATFRDLFRTLDKCGIGDEFTSAVRKRMFEGGRIYKNVRHYW